MNDLKEFLVFVFKSPVFWSVVIVWLTANIKWLFPQVPPEVLESATNLFTLIGLLVVSYLGGKDVEVKKVKRFMMQQQFRAEADKAKEVALHRG